MQRKGKDRGEGINQNKGMINDMEDAVEDVKKYKRNVKCNWKNLKQSKIINKTRLSIEKNKHEKTKREKSHKRQTAKRIKQNNKGLKD